MRIRSIRRLAFSRLVPPFAAAVVLLSACGGGGDAGSAGASVSATGTRSYAAGTISGFGSVIVNGVRFDNSTATVSDDEGQAAAADNLRLGMRVEIQGGAVHDDGTGPRAEASAIRFGSELVGRVSALDATAKSLVIVNQTVLVTDTTVIDDRLAGGFAGITVGSVLEVHGTRDATTGTITATRIEPVAAVASFKLRGPVANLDTTAKTFTIGAALVSYAGVTSVPTNLANGVVVRVRVQPAQVAGAWVATRLDAAGPRVDDADAAEIEGSITTFTSSTSFSVDGIAVDASKATFPNGTAGIVLGARVEVHGTSSNGVVTATEVKVETNAERHAEGFELHGALATIDTTAKTFVLRGVTVSYASATIDFRNGTAAMLVPGVQIEVRGTLSADGTMLQATRISFGD